MIKDNQSSLNRLHVVLDACVTTFSYLFAWYIVIGSGWAQMLGNKTLGADFYFAALIFIVPGYLLLYSFFNLYKIINLLCVKRHYSCTDSIYAVQNVDLKCR